MRSLSRVLSILIVAAVLAALALFLAPRIKQRVRQLEAHFPEILASEVTAYLGRDVQIGAIHYGGIYRQRHVLELDDLLLGRKGSETGPYLARVDRAVIHYTPRFLSLHLFKPLSAIGDIDLYNPDVYILHDRAGGWNVLHILKPGPPNRKSRLPLTTTIRVFNGQCTYLDYKPPHGSELFAARLAHVNGTALLEEGGPVRFNLAGAGAPLQAGLPSFVGPVRLDGMANVGDTGMDLHVGLDGIELGQVFGKYFALPSLSLAGGEGSGIVDLFRSNLTGREPPGERPAFSYSINARFSGLSARPPRLPLPITGAAGVFSLAQQAISFQIDRANYGPAVLAGSGFMANFHQPAVQANLTAAGITQAVIAPFVSRAILTAVHLLAPAAAVISIRGQASTPDVTGTLRVPAAIVQGVALHDATVRFGYSTRHVDISNVTASVAGGTASLGGVADLLNGGPAYHLTGYVRDAEVGSIPLPASLAAIHPSGRLTANLDVRGQGKALQVVARLQLRGAHVLLKGAPYSAGFASGVVNATYQPGSAGSPRTRIGARISAQNLRLLLRGRTYTASGLSTVVDTSLGRGRPAALETQGAITGLQGGNLRVQAASWSLRPRGPSQNSVDVLVVDPRGNVQVLGTSAPDFSHFNLQILARAVDLSTVSAFSPALQEVQGAAFINGNLTGSPTSPRFKGDVQVLGALYRGLPIDRIHGALDVSSSHVGLSALTLHIFPGELVLNGSIALNHFRATGLDLTADASHLSLSRLSGLLHITLPVTGSGSAHLSIAGPITSPLIQGQATVLNGTYRGYPISRATAEIRYRPDLSRMGSGQRLQTLATGFTLRSLEVQSPNGVITASGQPIGPGGELRFELRLANLSLRNLGLPKSLVALQKIGATAVIQGTISHPELLIQLPPTLVAINDQRFTLSASNILLIPEIGGALAPLPLPGVPVAALSIGDLSLERAGESLHVAGAFLPEMNATARISGLRISTAATVGNLPLPPGVTGTIQDAKLVVRGHLRMPAPTTALAGARESRELLSMMNGLSGDLSVSLSDFEVAAPTHTAANAEVILARFPQLGILGMQEGTPGADQELEAVAAAILAAASPPLPSPAVAPAPAKRGKNAANSTPSPTTLSPPTSSPAALSAADIAAAALPPPDRLHFDQGRLVAHFQSQRVLLDTLFLHQFASPTKPGIRISVVPSQDGTPAYFDLGGDMSVTVDAPQIDVRALQPWLPAAGAMSGALFLTLRATGPTQSPVITLSLDAPPDVSPLTYNKVKLSVARVIATAQEGRIQLVDLTVGTKQHVAHASGVLTWTHPGYLPRDAAIQLKAGLNNDNLSILHDIAPDTVDSASGPLDIAITVTGTTAAPVFHGLLVAGVPSRPGMIAIHRVEKPIKNLVIAVNFNGARANITQFTGQSDRGSFALTGWMDFPARTLSLTLSTQQFHLTDEGLIGSLVAGGAGASGASRSGTSFERIYGDLNSIIRIQGDFDSPLISGAATLRDAQLTITGLPKSTPVKAGVRTFDPRFDLTLTLGSGVRLQAVSLIGRVQANPSGAFSLKGSLSHMILNGRISTPRGGGYVSYIGGFWRLEESTVDIHYEPPANPDEQGLDLYVHSRLTTQISDTTTPSTHSSTFFAAAGQTLNVTMEAVGRPFTPNGLKIYLTSDPPRSQVDLERLISHQQELLGLVTGNAGTDASGLFSEAIRQAVIGNVLAPYEMQLATSLGLEEVNLEYQFGGPVFAEVSKHLVDGVSLRLIRALTADTADYQLYFDYRIRGNFTLSYGFLDRLGHQEQSFTIQSFLRF